jgi:hypothetical protein
MADPRKTLDLFKQVELTLAGIYTLFAKKFPSHAEEWKKMAGDELEHAQWIEILEAEMAKGNARFVASKIRDEGILAFHRYLLSVQASVEEQSIIISKAYVLAVDIERSLLERRLFEKFEGDCDKVCSILRILEQKQQAHVLMAQSLAERRMRTA